MKMLNGHGQAECDTGIHNQRMVWYYNGQCYVFYTYMTIERVRVRWDVGRVREEVEERPLQKVAVLIG